MAPRKTAAAGGNDQFPTLKLIMEKGPLSGQTKDFKPRIQIRIGRLVRGNTLSIKDDGISSKHLLIGVDTAAGGWAVTDLDSSNGTVLNGKRLEPLEPATLSDGDVIKIGEQTSIKVKFEASAGETEVSTSRNVRRNARRGVRKQGEELGVIDENSEFGFEIENENNLGPGVRNEKNVDLGVKGLKFEAVDEENVRGRRTRGSKAKELEHVSKEETNSMGKISSRRTRNSEKSEKVENLIQDLNSDMNNNLEPSGVKGVERVSMRRTRSSRKEGNIGDPLINLSVLEGKKPQKGTRGRKNILVEAPSDVKEKEAPNLEDQELLDEEKVMSEVEVDKLLESETRERENATAFASTSGVKDNGVSVEIGEIVADLEKMTLGEWFEFLEVYLPKHIIDETEQMISEMRKKAERLNEFMLQHKNAKSGVVMD
ncbi:FHA domain-containing protein [Striga hermonthica]|uniref:FHA domain-containing protein n=1 Tax=Striga hermonthica TaxID=68872 RepID=A0A9N7R590_STRHE|nr:FHA domain-containing protein [Striga hermonthica]